ncbi:MAG: alpha/beta hydrolase, partial [Dehalococcoidia bacterium]
MPTVEGTFVHLPGRGLRLHYRDWGGDGPPLILLHGLSSGSRIWDWTAPLLAQRFRVIALDQRSHGLSDAPDDGYGFDDVTADLDAFIEALGLERPALAGHSWGASVALTYAVAHPARAVVLIDGGVIELSSRGTWEDAEARMRPPDIDGTPVETFLGFMRRWPNLQDMWKEDLPDMVLSNFEVRDDKVYRRLAIPNHMKIARAIFDLKPSELLPEIACPLMIISCHQEPKTELEQSWLDVRLEGIEAARRVVAR